MPLETRLGGIFLVCLQGAFEESRAEDTEVGDRVSGPHQVGQHHALVAYLVHGVRMGREGQGHIGVVFQGMAVHVAFAGIVKVFADPAEFFLGMGIACLLGYQ